MPSGDRLCIEFPFVLLSSLGGTLQNNTLAALDYVIDVCCWQLECVAPVLCENGPLWIKSGLLYTSVVFCGVNSFCFFFLFKQQQTGPISATLVLTRPIKGPQEVVLDLEMVTVNSVVNFRGSSVIRLTIFVSEHSFWSPGPADTSRALSLFHYAACLVLMDLLLQAFVIQITNWESSAF